MKLPREKARARNLVFTALGCIMTACALIYGNLLPHGFHLETNSIKELEQSIRQIQAQIDGLPQRLIRETGGTLGHRTLRNELGGDPPWLEVDLGESSTFDLLALIPMVNINENQKMSDFGFPRRFQVFVFEGPDDTTGRLIFDSIKRPESAEPNQSPILVACAGTSARRVRVIALEPSTPPIEGTPVFALAELMVLRDYQNLAIGKPVAASHATHFPPIYEPGYVTDGYMPFSHPRTAKKGSTNYALIRRERSNTPISIIIDLGKSFPIDEIRLFPVHLGNNFSIFHRTGLGFPRQFTIDLSESPDFQSVETVFSTGESDYLPPGHRLAIFSAGGTTGRFVRLTSTKLPPDPSRGTAVLALAEIEVISKGNPVSHDASVSVVPNEFYTNSQAHRLVDGLSSHGEIPLLRDWLVHLSERNHLELQLAALKQDLSRESLHQSQLLQRLSWVVGLGIPFLAVIVIWQRLARLRYINRMRENLAADLHDEIGGNFSGIALLCDQLSGAENMPQSFLPQLDSIAKTARDSAQNTRNLVTFLESHNVQGDLISNLKATATLLLTQLPHDFKATGLANEDRLNPKEKWHLLLFFKEALANVIKHAGATHVDVRLELTSACLKLSINDNGHGFQNDQNPIRLPSHLKLRAMKFGGEATITSSAKGTLITLIKSL